jgi:hypothetical protein
MLKAWTNTKDQVQLLLFCRFCWTSAIAVAMGWVLQLTIFLGYYVLHERRVAANRYDCLCCCTRRESISGTDPSIEDPDKSMPAEAAKPLPIGMLSSNKDSLLQQAINKYILPLMLHPIGKVVIVLLVVAVAVLGGIGVAEVTEGLPTGSLAPDGHYYKTFDTKLDAFRFQTGALQPCCLYRNAVLHAYHLNAQTNKQTNKRTRK